MRALPSWWKTCHPTFPFTAEAAHGRRRLGQAPSVRLHLCSVGDMPRVGPRMPPACCHRQRRIRAASADHHSFVASISSAGCRGIGRAPLVWDLGMARDCRIWYPGPLDVKRVVQIGFSKVGGTFLQISPRYPLFFCILPFPLGSIQP
jgi:hypothetical protein